MRCIPGVTGRSALCQSLAGAGCQGNFHSNAFLFIAIDILGLGDAGAVLQSRIHGNDSGVCFVTSFQHQRIEFRVRERLQLDQRRRRSLL